MKQRPKLGQHFLINKKIAERIVSLSGITKKDTVLEIGGGTGSLTDALLNLGCHVISVELDNSLASFLQKRFRGRENLEIINKDILSLNIEQLSNEKNMKLKVAGNIPYQITTPVLNHLINNRKYIENATLMLQYDVAKRIIAPSNSRERGSLSIFIQYYTKPVLLFRVSPGSFFPPPKVTSAVLNFKFLIKPPVDVHNETNFFSLIHEIFSYRRKMLRWVLTKKFSLTNSLLSILEQETKIDSTRRGETLDIMEFATLSRWLDRK